MLCHRNYCADNCLRDFFDTILDVKERANKFQCLLTLHTGLPFFDKGAARQLSVRLMMELFVMTYSITR